MPTTRPGAHAVRRSARPVAGAAVAAAALLVLAACGTTPAPSPGRSSSGAPSQATSSAPVRDVTAQPRAADGALACPGSLASAEGMTVPVRPQGVRGGDRLLPDRQPRSLVVCSYPVLDISATTPLAAPFPRSTRAVLTGAKRADVVALLTWAPRWNGRERPCTSMGGDETAYLVGADLGDAVVWVAAKADPNACSRATNGDFVSGAPVGTDLAAVTGGRPLPRPAGGGVCTERSWGRLGDDVDLVPAGDPRVTVCRDGVDGTARAVPLDGASGAAVVAALRALPTRPTSSMCQGSGGLSDQRFTLVLAWPAGPPVRVGVDPTCRPSVLGQNLESDDAGGLVALVERWSPPIPGPDPDGSVSSPT
ncbi:hypothetical protein GCM10023258_21400 [Terrabacter aeriphilus]|uniref:Uncharacterized protein n=1 Tax=Terrabacter aeriphilus TaxID=515662 RepID=A0ABP9JDX6_9MICO